MSQISRPCIGLLGGMGPAAGVELQRLIIKATPANTDQDHIRVLCLTEPNIPDRSASLKQDGGDTYVAAVQNAAQMLERAGATILVIACNTAHARYVDIQRSVSIPIFHLVEAAVQSIVAPAGPQIGVLATDGTLGSQVFENHLQRRGLQQVTPSTADQATIMTLIYEIKAGMVKPEDAADRLMPFIATWQSQGIRTVILGCTELSLCFESLTQRTNIHLIDPLRTAANALVSIMKAEVSLPSPDPHPPQPSRQFST